MFKNLGAKAIKKDLTNIKSLCALLDNPQNSFKTIHIAGTNGKGTVSHLIASVLQSSGYKVGLYTSPHYKDFRERIKINGAFISEEEVATFIEANKARVEEISPSFFELTVAMAFKHFSDSKVDIAVIETGLGGRLDSTNIILPELSVITNISFDHTGVLGHTIPKIASEKAGIIKRNIPVIIGEPNSEAEPVFEAVASENGSELTKAFKDIKLFYKETIEDKTIYDVYNPKEESFTDFRVQLRGPFIRRNVITALSAVYNLKNRDWNITDESIRHGFEQVRTQAKYLGRWQILSSEPLTIADSGHNEAAFKQAMAYLKSLEYEQLHIVLGFVRDKDIDKMLRLLPSDAILYFAQAKIPRALEVENLYQTAKNLGLEGERFSSVSEAISVAKNAASAKDLIFIGGSSFVVAEVI